MKSREELLSTLTDVLVEDFEIEASEITLEANLYEELELDSIDAVDLMIELKELTGKKMALEDFQEVKTVGDVVDAVHKILQSQQN